MQFEQSTPCARGVKEQGQCMRISKGGQEGHLLHGRFILNMQTPSPTAKIEKCPMREILYVLLPVTGHPAVPMLVYEYYPPLSPPVSKHCYSLTRH